MEVGRGFKLAKKNFGAAVGSSEINDLPIFLEEKKETKPTSSIGSQMRMSESRENSLDQLIEQSRAGHDRIRVDQQVAVICTGDTVR